MAIHRKFETISHRTPSDLNLLIREAVPSDADALIELVTHYGNNATMIPLEPGEFVPTRKDELGWISSFQQENSLLLLAEHKGQLIGNIDITGSSRRKMLHTAEMGMSVRKEFQGKGVGKELLKQAIVWAEKNRFLELLWLQVYEDNTVARKLYESIGFEISGKQKNFFHEKRGRIANVIMTLYLAKNSSR